MTPALLVEAATGSQVVWLTWVVTLGVFVGIFAATYLRDISQLLVEIKKLLEKK